jgi:hypothetical protein
MKNKMDKYRDFEKNLEATLYEGIVKLGYLEGEPIGIFYTTDLFLHLLGIENTDKEDRVNTIKDIIGYLEPRFGRIKIGVEKTRFKITVPPEGVRYVLDKNKNNTFLKDLIDAMGNKDCNIEQVHAVFLKYSSQVILEEADHEEFDYIIYFKDKGIDPFIYCFTFNEMSKYYHRLTEYDYKRL